MLVDCVLVDCTADAVGAAVVLCARRTFCEFDRANAISPDSRSARLILEEGGLGCMVRVGDLPAI